jgi:hypothetical protein
MGYGFLLASIITMSLAVSAAPSSPPTRITVPDTIGCRRAAVTAVRAWFGAIGTGDTAAVRRSVSPRFAWISAGRSGWPEPFFRASQLGELFAYVRRRSAQHERIANVSIPFGDWHDGRLMLGTVSYTRTADDVVGTEYWLGKGEYECGSGIHVLSTGPQGSPGHRR